MPQIQHLDDLDPRGSDYGHPKLGQRLRAAFSKLRSHPQVHYLLKTLAKVVWIGADGNYTAGRGGYAIKGIVIHTMVGSLASCDTTFANPARQASANYGVACDGSVIHEYVVEANTAWHCGRYYPDATHPFGNVNTVGIEHCDNGNYNSPRPDGLYATSAELVKEICARYKIPITRTYIRKHSEVSVAPTGCPDSLDINRIVAMAAGLYGPPVPIPITSGDEDMLYVGPVHAKAATLKVFAAGHGYDERTTSSRPKNAYAVGASIVTTGYSYSTSPVQSPDLGGGVPGPDFLWWQIGADWMPDAYLDTTGVAGAPSPNLPAAEPLTLFFASQAQVAALPVGKQGIQGIPGIPGKDSVVPGPKGDPGPASTVPGPKGDAGIVPNHHHDSFTTGTQIVP